MSGLVNGWMKGRMDGQMNGSSPTSCFLIIMRERQANFKQPEDVFLSLELLETPAPLAGRIDPLWGGQASGFVQQRWGAPGG